MAHRKPYVAPGTRGPVTENPVTGRDPDGRINKGKGTGANRDWGPQYPGGVTENPKSWDDKSKD